MTAVIGIGVDAVDLSRFRDVLARRPALAERLFTPGERAYAGRTADPVVRLAARFAAKEATMKALGVGLGAFGFREVEVVREGTTAPTLVLRGAAEALAARAGVARWHLSLTHSDLVAMASVLAEGGPVPAEGGFLGPGGPSGGVPRRSEPARGVGAAPGG